MALVEAYDSPILVTGAAGFIGAAVCQALMAEGHEVIGVDSLNDYYEVGLKQYRMNTLLQEKAFSFLQLNLSDAQAVASLFSKHRFQLVIHLAAQAGVRYSLENPSAYIESNILGFQSILDACREHVPAHLVFASSSSVYGNSQHSPFAEADSTDTPVSLYAATKKSNEVVGHSYSTLYGIPMTGLRFFTVYGPAGRPDMAYFSFTRAILAGEPIRVFNHGNLERDFTYIDDIVAGVLAVAKAPPTETKIPCRLMNLGNNTPVKLGYFIDLLESLLGVKAVKEFVDMQPGDVYKTYADIDAAQTLVGYEPSIQIETGLEKFVEWYRHYSG